MTPARPSQSVFKLDSAKGCFTQPYFHAVRFNYHEVNMLMWTSQYSFKNQGHQILKSQSPNKHLTAIAKLGFLECQHRASASRYICMYGFHWIPLLVELHWIKSNRVSYLGSECTNGSQRWVCDRRIYSIAVDRQLYRSVQRSTKHY